MPSPLTSPVVAVAVSSSEGDCVLHLHQAVLDAIPYFSAQQARWLNKPLSVELPDGVGLEALGAVLEKVYSSRLPARPTASQALGVVQLASMLDCDKALLDSLVLELRSSLRTDSDVQVVNSFCERHETCPELAQLAKRLRRSPKGQREFELAELQVMLANGLQHDNAEMLRLAEAHLKRHSRRSASDLTEIVAIIGAQAASHLSCKRGYSLALELVDVHPRFYKYMVDRLFSSEVMFDAQSSWSKYCKDFLDLGVQKVKAGDMDVGNLVAFFRHISAPNWVPDIRSPLYKKPPVIHSEFREPLVSSLKEVDGPVQVELCKVFLDMHDQHFCWLVCAELFQSLAVEAKATFTDRIARLNDHYLRGVVTLGLLDLLDADCKRLFCLKAHIFKPDITARLVDLAMPEVPDDGF